MRRALQRTFVVFAGGCFGMYSLNRCRSAVRAEDRRTPGVTPRKASRDSPQRVRAGILSADFAQFEFKDCRVLLHRVRSR
jgi:hypothetical protein